MTNGARGCTAGRSWCSPASPESLALVEHARSLIAEAFGSKDPQTAQFDTPVEEFAAVLAELKPKFIHHPASKERIQGSARILPLRSRSDLLRRSAHAHIDIRRLSDVGNLVCVPSAPRYLVLGAVQPTELVDPDLSRSCRRT